MTDMQEEKSKFKNLNYFNFQQFFILLFIKNLKKNNKKNKKIIKMNSKQIKILIIQKLMMKMS